MNFDNKICSASFHLPLTMISILVVALLAVSGFAAPERVVNKRTDGAPVIPSGWTALGCYT